MIQNDLQRQVVIRKRTELRNSLKEMMKHDCPDYIIPEIYQVRKDSTKGLIDCLTKQLEAYDGKDKNSTN